MQSRSNQELQDAAHHLLYEIRMTLSLLSVPPSYALTNNLLIEGRLLHLRILNEAFSKEVGREDDVKIRHFGIDNVEPFFKGDEKKRVDKLAMHLTYSRGAVDENSSWDFGKIWKIAKLEIRKAVMGLTIWVDEDAPDNKSLSELVRYVQSVIDR